jgi:pyruvate carboxylase
MIAADIGRNGIRRLLVANRGEIAIRVFRAASELGIATIAIYAEEDKLSLHRFKADEAYQVGRAADGREALGPRDSYLSIDEVMRVAREAKADAIHPGYGFLSESPELVDACAQNGLIFVGPSAQTMRTLGNKVAARDLAISVGVPVMPASPQLPDHPKQIRELAAAIGYPVMLKASCGGGGRGMRPILTEAALLDAVDSARREAKSAFGKDEVFLEKLITHARHIEVQLLGDRHGNQVHLFERDCTIQRRHQKVIERAPAACLDDEQRQGLCDAALRIGAATDYIGAGTVEFLLDVQTGSLYFIEVNPRIQVEHTVTEQITGLDIVKAQIGIAGGGRLGRVSETGIPEQGSIVRSGHALQCRITTENPDNHFIPDYGRVSAYRGAFGFGIRVDGGTAYSGAVVTRHYDPLLEKVTAWAPSFEEVVARMDRALREYRIRGVATNLTFLEAVLNHPAFLADDYTTRFIDETPALLQSNRRSDRATKLLGYIADVTVNGHPEVRDRPAPRAKIVTPERPRGIQPARAASPNPRAVLDRDGPQALGRWIRQQERVLITDTTMRDGHQSLLATRMRTFDIAAVAPAYALGLPDLLSLECWGGATFDVAMRFLSEDPWERLAAIREAAPGMLTQMLLRGANAVGYTNYPDNTVRFFIREAARAGMDIFRIFDCLNWVENMRVVIDAVAAENKLAEGAICYTGDILDPARAKYSLKYYVSLARELDRAGCHSLAIKDMAGLLKPAAAALLVQTLRQETDLPLRLHTHDTSGIAGATIMAAVDAGIDAVDAAMDSMSGTTSQPCLGSLVEALRHGTRQTGLDAGNIRKISAYWSDARAQYAAFETEQKSGASEVYLHEMPGGQFTNLKEQARSLGLDRRWDEVAAAYRQANDLFGDIVKVTPSSKVVGDMALMMVSQGLSPADVLDPGRDVAFPASVVEMMRGDLGQPHGGWPEALQRRVLGEQRPITVRPAQLMPDHDLARARREAEAAAQRSLAEREVASYLMYPKIFTDFCAVSAKYGPLSRLPTSVFFYGMNVGDEISIEIEPGKSLVVVLHAIGERNERGEIKLFFELNGQPRAVTVLDRQAGKAVERLKANDADDSHVGAPMPGMISTLSVSEGQEIRSGDILMTIEAMKMETVLRASRDGRLSRLCVALGETVGSKDLLAVIS